jgi:hypothetical protein
VDDVWNTDHARHFLVGGSRCLLLTTTRKIEIAEEIGALAIELEEMTPAEAVSLVEKWSGPLQDVDRKNGEWLMGEVEYLPLAIELIGAQVHKLGWTEYRRRWEDQKLKAIRRGRRSRGKEDNLWDSLELSIQSLTDEDRGRYFSMGVFPEDTPFPPMACAVLWACAEDEVADLLIDFAGQALLQRRREFEPSRYAFHDLFYQIVIERLNGESSGGRTDAHRRLVEGYRGLCRGAWHNGPSDGYYLDHLAYHLAEAGLLNDLYGLLGAPWMQRKIKEFHSHQSFAADVQTAIEASRTEDPPNLLQLCRGCLISATLLSLAAATPLDVITVLAYCGNIDEARGYASLNESTERRFLALSRVAQVLAERTSVCPR